jgi:hypothetical protein
VVVAARSYLFESTTWTFSPLRECSHAIEYSIERWKRAKNKQHGERRLERLV